MDLQELQERQSWTLDQKIDHAVGTIENFVSRTGKNVYVSFSGGKDSTVLLDLTRRFYKKDTPAVFCNTGNEYPEILKFVKSVDNVTILKVKTTMVQIIQKQGFPLISKDVSEKLRQIRHSKSKKLVDIRMNGYPGRKCTMARLPRKWLYLKDAKFDISERCCDVLKKSRFKKYERENDLCPLIGIRAEESRLRMMQYIIRGGCSAFNGPRPRSFPISIFTEKDIHDYISRFNVHICSIYNDPCVHRTGCMMCGFGADQDPEHFTYLYQHYPKVYNYFMRLENNGVSYREALHECGVTLPDDNNLVKS